MFPRSYKTPVRKFNQSGFMNKYLLVISISTVTVIFIQLLDVNKEWIDAAKKNNETNLFNFVCYVK